MTLDDIRAVARQDFNEMDVPTDLWDAFWAGYLSAIKRHACDDTKC